MLPSIKYILLALISFSFYSANVLFIPKPVEAGEPILDSNCGYHIRTGESVRRIPENQQGSIFFISQFQANNQTYTLQVWKFKTGKSIFCLFPSKFTFGTNKSIFAIKLKGVPLIQDKLIEKVFKDKSRKNHYIVLVRDNNVGTYYRLNLSNPEQPKLSKK